MKGWNSEGRLLKADEGPLARSLKSGEAIVGEQIEINLDDGSRRVLTVSMQQIRSIKLEHGISRVPALALTAFAREEDGQRCLEAGYDAHLAEPVDPDRLLQQIAHLTGRRAF